MVSIVIPVYNGSNYLREAIDSALAQTYKNLEVIVVNDGSTDGGATEAIALEYGNRIRYFNKPNGGVSSALNVGIRNMRGEYFSWLSHDDAYCPQKIEKQIAALSRIEDKYAVVRCKTEYMDADSKPIQRARVKKLRRDVFSPWRDALLSLYRDGTYNGCALLIHRHIFDVCGLFQEDYRYNQDGLMWTTIFLHRFSMLSIPYAGVRSRIHGGQLTRRGLGLFHKECEEMSAFLLPELCACTDRKYRFVLEYAKFNAKHGNRAVVRKVLKESDRKVLTFPERCTVHAYCFYGRLRQVAKKVYYKLFRRIRVKG